MTNTMNRRQALKTIAATGLGAAFAANSALAEAAPTTPFFSQRDLANSFWIGPNLFSFLSDAETTNGIYTLVDATAPSGAVIALHKHTREDEILFLQEGEMEVTINGVARLVGAGEHTFMPRGNEHTFRVTSSIPARALVMFTPGGLEGAYKQIGRPAQRLELPPTPSAPTPEQGARVAEIFASYGYYILPPTN
jgi:mannose-6-phosphate isomerase-like protein (cupin superfamily)